jgi:hypothetical protein
VVEAGSFVKAAQVLRSSTTPVSRLVQDLERRLGGRLLQRTTRRLSLTEAGRDYWLRAKQILADLAEADGAVSAVTRRAAGLLSHQQWRYLSRRGPRSSGYRPSARFPHRAGSRRRAPQGLIAVRCDSLTDPIGLRLSFRDATKRACVDIRPDGYISVGRPRNSSITPTGGPAPCGMAATSHRWCRRGLLAVLPARHRAQSRARRSGHGPLRLSVVQLSCHWARSTRPAAHTAFLSIYLALGADDAKRRAAYRDLFGSALDDVSLSELRMALNQDQPIGNDRFYREIESMSGQRRELRKRGRSRKSKDEGLGMKASCP